MKKYLNALPEDVKELIAAASDISERQNINAYLVGGFVRDLLLEVKNLDLDIVVEGDGIQFAQALGTRFRAKIISHRRFGTATVILTNGHKIDVATARKETYPHPGSLPVVSAGSLRNDLFRRDFTVNAMAVSIGKDKFGQLIDYFGGKKDLESKKIRVLHDLSFIDDPTRILRGIRFEKRYNFKFEAATFRILKKAIKQRMLDRVQPHRLRDELLLILKEEDPLRNIRRVAGVCGLEFVSPLLSASGRMFELMRRAGREADDFREKFPHRRRLQAHVMYLMCLLDELSLAQAKKLCARFAFRSGETKQIIDYKRVRSRAGAALSKTSISPERIFRLLEPLSYEAIIMLKAGYRSRVLQRHIEDFFRIYNGMRLCISGEDLRTLGVAPGPNYQKILSKVLKAKLSGAISTREDELNLIKRLLFSL